MIREPYHKATRYNSNWWAEAGLHLLTTLLSLGTKSMDILSGSQAGIEALKALLMLSAKSLDFLRCS